MSDTISSGGFSSATAYCWSWAKARSRSFFGPLYSQAKQPRRQTSAQPSPPAVLLAPFSKANHSPLGSAEIGSGTSRSAQRSLKWDWEAERSFSSTPCHLAMKSCGFMRLERRSCARIQFRDDACQVTLNTQIVVRQEEPLGDLQWRGTLQEP